MAAATPTLRVSQRARSEGAVVPVTRVMRAYPTRVAIPRGRTGLKVASWAAVEHLASVSVLRLRDHLGEVEAETLEQIRRVLRLVLDLPEVA